MKSLYLRAGLALLCAVVLSACGGNNGSMLLQGSINGLTKEGLVLVNKSTGEKLTVPANTTIFSFTRLLAVDEQFDVEVDTQPTGAVCTLTNNTGTASIYTVSNIVVSCPSNPYTLGGIVYGLKTTGLVLVNGADTAAVLPSTPPGADVPYTFPTKVANGAPFGVTVLAQPAGQVCTVDPVRGVGTMPAYDALQLYVYCQ